jgi:hypothetical protein
MNLGAVKDFINSFEDIKGVEIYAFLGKPNIELSLQRIHYNYITQNNEIRRNLLVFYGEIILKSETLTLREYTHDGETFNEITVREDKYNINEEDYQSILKMLKTIMVKFMKTL